MRLAASKLFQHLLELVLERRLVLAIAESANRSWTLGFRV